MNESVKRSTIKKNQNSSLYVSDCPESIFVDIHAPANEEYGNANYPYKRSESLAREYLVQENRSLTAHHDTERKSDPSHFELESQLATQSEERNAKSATP